MAFWILREVDAKHLTAALRVESAKRKTESVRHSQPFRFLLFTYMAWAVTSV